MKYFLHDTSAFDDEKITELYMKFGYEGLGLFYTILEKIGKQEKPIKTEVLKTQLRVGKRLNKCWLFMEEIGIISSNNGETFNEQLLNFSEKYQIKKEKNREKVSEWRDNQANKNNVTGYEPVRNQPKVKESKIKESKGIKEEPDKPAEVKTDFISDIISVFKSAYRHTRGVDYIITNPGKERAAAGKLAKVYRERNPDHTSDEAIASLYTFFERALEIDDGWLFDNMSLPIISSKINEITTILRNGSKRKNNKEGTTDAELAAITFKYFGTHAY